MKRINSRLDSAIPISRAVYHKSRSTTEHVFAAKLIIEITTSSVYETLYLLPFRHEQSVRQYTNVLNQDELHLI